MEGKAFFFLLVGVLLILAVTSARGRDAVDVVLGRKKAAANG